jgi:hypothetical protein
LTDVQEQTAESAEPGKPGRPTKFSDKLAETILALAAEGRTDAEIAETLGIARSTLALWKGRHARFSDALAEAKDHADELVEAALLQRAIGYQHPAVKFFCYEGVVVKQEYTEIHAPDVGAAKFWLANRQPDRWREVKALEHSGPGGKPIEVMTAKEVEDAAARILAAVPPSVESDDPEEHGGGHFD